MSELNDAVNVNSSENLISVSCCGVYRLVFISADKIRIGDRVVFLPSGSYVDRRLRNLTKGDVGTVIGFGRLTQYEPRNRVFRDRSGTYLINSLPAVQWDSGEVTEATSPLYIGPVNANILSERGCDTIYQQAFNTATYIGPLPETPYCEGMTVELLDRNQNIKIGIIGDVDYYSLMLASDQQKQFERVYSVSFQNNTNSSNSGGLFSQSDILAVLDKGNFMRHEINLAAGFIVEPLVFSNTEEEINFYRAIGEVIQVKDPITIGYCWALTSAIEAIKDEIIDFFVEEKDGFRLGYKFKNNPELAARVRAEFSQRSI